MQIMSSTKYLFLLLLPRTIFLYCFTMVYNREEFNLKTSFQEK